MSQRCRLVRTANQNCHPSPPGPPGPDEDNPPFGRIQIDPLQCIGCKKCLSKGPDGCFLDGCPWDAIVMVDIAEVEKEVGPMSY